MSSLLGAFDYFYAWPSVFFAHVNLTRRWKSILNEGLLLSMIFLAAIVSQAVSQKKKSAAVRNRSRNLSTVFFEIVNALKVRRPSTRLVACVSWLNCYCAQEF